MGIITKIKNFFKNKKEIDIKTIKRIQKLKKSDDSKKMMALLKKELIENDSFEESLKNLIEDDKKKSINLVETEKIELI